jgi:hypothetical protein
VNYHLSSCYDSRIEEKSLLGLAGHEQRYFPAPYWLEQAQLPEQKISREFRRFYVSILASLTTCKRLAVDTGDLGTFLPF